MALCDMIKPELAKKEVGDAECLAYMMPQFQEKAMSSDWCEIYLYLAGRVLKRWKQYDVLPQECKVEELSNYQMKKLKDLKNWIYEKRGGKLVNPILTALREVFLTTKKK